MRTHSNKTPKEKGQDSASKASQKQSRNKSTAQFVDKRPAAMLQRKFKEFVANDSPIQLGKKGESQSKTAGGHSMGQSHSNVDNRGKASGHGRKAAEAGANHSNEKRSRMIDQMANHNVEKKKAESKNEREEREKNEALEAAKKDKIKSRKIKEQRGRRKN